jgi:hypothetical protein
LRAAHTEPVEEDTGFEDDVTAVGEGKVTSSSVRHCFDHRRRCSTYAGERVVPSVCCDPLTRGVLGGEREGTPEVGRAPAIGVERMGTCAGEEGIARAMRRVRTTVKRGRTRVRCLKRRCWE